MVTWNHNWSSAFHLELETSEVRQEQEFLVFDLFDTLNGIGGAMGLFLGWSVFYLVGHLANGVKNIWRSSMNSQMVGLFYPFVLYSSTVFFKDIFAFLPHQVPNRT